MRTEEDIKDEYSKCLEECDKENEFANGYIKGLEFALFDWWFVRDRQETISKLKKVD
jgi:hypothetical protein